MTQNTSPVPRTVVVIGNGMVGHRFCEKLVELDTERRFRIVTFCEEPRAAYDRVGLTSFFAHRDAEKLMLARLDWYREQGIELHVGDRADKIDRQAKVVRTVTGLRPWRVIWWARGARDCLELPVGAVEASGTVRGDQLAVSPSA